MALQIGDAAPHFTLVSDEKKNVQLIDFKGENVVLLFFPLAFTSVCTEELCGMRDNISTFNNLDAQVLAVSVDSPFVLERFKTELKLNFPLLSDFNKDVSGAYHSLYNDFVLNMKGVSKRAAFVIDKKGIICYAEVLEDATKLPDITAVKKTLEKLNYIVAD